MRKKLFFFLCSMISFCYAAERQSELPSYVSVSSYKNNRKTQEDRCFYGLIYDIENIQQGSLFAVLDGHSGEEVADYMAKNLPAKFEKHLNCSLTKKQAFENAFSECEEYAINQPVGGSTALAVYIKNRKAHIVNVGDSRCVFGSNNKVLLATLDHTPDREDERNRIMQTGGMVYRYRDVDSKIVAPWRINGLMMSRIIGDRFPKGKQVDGEKIFIEKQKKISFEGDIVPVLLEQWGKGFEANYLECEPKVGQVIADLEYIKQELTDEYRWLILATDGLWDVMSNEKAVQKVQSYYDKWCKKLANIKEDKNLAGFDFKVSFSNKLACAAIKKGSQDNITVLVVDLLELYKNSNK